MAGACFGDVFSDWEALTHSGLAQVPYAACCGDVTGKSLTGRVSASTSSESRVGALSMASQGVRCYLCVGEAMGRNKRAGARCAAGGASCSVGFGKLVPCW